MRRHEGDSRRRRLSRTRTLLTQRSLSKYIVLLPYSLSTQRDVTSKIELLVHSLLCDAAHFCIFRMPNVYPIRVTKLMLLFALLALMDFTDVVLGESTGGHSVTGYPSSQAIRNLRVALSQNEGNHTAVMQNKTSSDSESESRPMPISRPLHPSLNRDKLPNGIQLFIDMAQRGSEILNFMMTRGQHLHYPIPRIS